MIELRRVSKQFGTRVAVDELSLVVPRGEIFGLLGHNGAGKSTAIGMMLGQVWPSGGAVQVCGHDITRARQLALERVGAIFETPAFYDYLSGWRNLEILAHYTAPTSRKRIAEVVDWVGLTGREHGRVKTYSHGMRARLALAQALLPGPELLILDEPGEGLDPEGIHEMRQTILRLHRELNLTILLSSHLLSEVEQTCTRIAVLNRGRKVFEGSVSDIRAVKGEVRLRTNRFDEAILLLREDGLIMGTPGREVITLAPGISTAQISKALITAGFDLDGIWQQEQTLEEFYLSLVRLPPPLPSTN